MARGGKQGKGRTAGWLKTAQLVAEDRRLPVAERRYLEVEVPGGGGPMWFRRVPSGEFWMRSRDLSRGGRLARELPRHLVRIDYDFWLAVFPVTHRQFAAWIRLDPSAMAREAAQEQRMDCAESNEPADNMNWHEAVAFCAWMQTFCIMERAFRFSLPTEVEWECACRAGTDTEFHSGDGFAAADEVAWFSDNCGFSGVRDVGGKNPNPLGIYDMHGNVDEWCCDSHNPRIYRGRAGSYSASLGSRYLVESQAVGGSEDWRSIRGGAYWSPFDLCSSAIRDSRPASMKMPGLGFRVCILPDAEEVPARAMVRSGSRRRSPTRPPADDLSQLRVPPVPRKPAKKRKDKP